MAVKFPAGKIIVVLAIAGWIFPSGPVDAETASSSSAVVNPAVAVIPAHPGENLPADNTVSLTNDPNEVINGILAGDSSKPGTPGIVNDITKAGFAQADTVLAADSKNISPGVRTADLVWLMALAVCFGVVTTLFRKVRARGTPASPPVTALTLPTDPPPSLINRG